VKVYENTKDVGRLNPFTESENIYQDGEGKGHEKF